MGIDLFEPFKEMEMFWGTPDGDLISVGRVKDEKLTLSATDEAGDTRILFSKNAEFTCTCEDARINIQMLIQHFGPNANKRIAHLAAHAKKDRVRKKNWRRAFDMKG